MLLALEASTPGGIVYKIQTLGGIKARSDTLGLLLS
jgi:hypothetical protein